MRDWLTGLLLTGAWEASWFAIIRTEAQGSRAAVQPQGKPWSNPTGLQTRGVHGVSPSLSPKVQRLEALMSKDKRRGMAWLKQRAYVPFFHLSFLSRPSVDWIVVTCISEGNFFPRSADVNANFFQKHPHRHTKKQCFTALWGPLAQLFNYLSILTTLYLNHLTSLKLTTKTIDEIKFINIYRTLHLKIAEYTFFSSAHGALAKKWISWFYYFKKISYTKYGLWPKGN